MKTLIDFFKTIDEYYEYLISKGQKFSEEGWPIIDKECFLEDAPDIMVPFYKRKDKLVQNYPSVAICSFCPDKDIYPRLDKVLADIEEYKKYSAVVAADLTVTKDMDIEWQKVIMLTNNLFMAILAINGIKVIANTRIGSPQTLKYLLHIPHNVTCASGFLGCAKTNETDMEYIGKILSLRPSYLLIYGKCHDVEKEKINRMGIRYKIYSDYHSLSKKRRNFNG